MDAKQAVVERIKVMEDDCLVNENLYCQGMVEGLKVALHLIVKSENEEKLSKILETQIKDKPEIEIYKIH